MNKYSYIIPFYNVRPYVTACLDSVLAQTYPNWECICVDDGSPDGLGEILDQYSAKDSRIKVIHQPNSGVGAARNAALSVMTGDWFLFVDGDDLSSPHTCEMCERMVNNFPDADMLMLGETSFEQDAKCVWTDALPNINLRHKDVHSYIDSKVFNPGFCTRVYRAAVFGKIKFSGLIRGQDRYYIVDCMPYVNTVVFADYAISGVRNRKGSTTRSPTNINKVKAELKYIEHAFDLFRHTNRRVDKFLIRTHLNKLMETCLCEWHTIFSGEDRIHIFEEWLSVVKKVSNVQFVSGFQEMRIKLVARHPNRLLIWLLCILPHKLKLLGFHR